MNPKTASAVSRIEKILRASTAQVPVALLPTEGRRGEILPLIPAHFDGTPIDPSVCPEEYPQLNLVRAGIISHTDHAERVRGALRGREIRVAEGSDPLGYSLCYQALLQDLVWPKLIVRGLMGMQLDALSAYAGREGFDITPEDMVDNSARDIGEEMRLSVRLQLIGEPVEGLDLTREIRVSVRRLFDFLVPKATPERLVIEKGVEYIFISHIYSMEREETQEYVHEVKRRKVFRCCNNVPGRITYLKILRKAVSGCEGAFLQACR